MVASNTFGRQIVVPLANKSGGSVAAGDVVVIASANTDAFTTTTSAASTAIVGVAQETIANNATGRICLGGYVPLVNVNASCTVLHYGTTHTVAKQATDAGTSRISGTCMVFLSTSATPDAYLYNPDLGGASLTNPMNAVGDIIQGTTAGAPARLGAGTAGLVLTSAGAATPLVWASKFPAYGVALVATDEGTTSGSFTDLATGGPAVTLTINTAVKVTISADIYGSVVTTYGAMGVALSSANTVAASDTKKLLIADDPSSNGVQLSRVIAFTGLTPGSTVFTAKYYRSGGGTAHFRYRELLVECLD